MFGMRASARHRARRTRSASGSTKLGIGLDKLGIGIGIGIGTGVDERAQHQARRTRLHPLDERFARLDERARHELANAARRAIGTGHANARDRDQSRERGRRPHSDGRRSRSGRARRGVGDGPSERDWAGRRRGGEWVDGPSRRGAAPDRAGCPSRAARSPTPLPIAFRAPTAATDGCCLR
jgi:hypothetical protein